MRAILSRLKNWVYQCPKQEPEAPVMTLQSLSRDYLTSDVTQYLIERTNHRDQLFKDAESAILGRNYTEALALVRKGWQLSGR